MDPLEQLLSDPLMGPIAGPLLAALWCVLVPDRFGGLRVVGAVVAAVFAGSLVVGHLGGDVVGHPALVTDPLSTLCSLGAALATGLVAVFMLGWSGDRSGTAGHRLLLACLCLTLAAANAVFFARGLLILLVAWGALAVLLYLMVGAAGARAAGAARKAAMIVGGADAALLLGVVLLEGTELGTRSVDETLAQSEGAVFILLAVAALAKLGAAPLHAWVAPVAARAHGPTAALLLGAVDKLVGGYLLFRLVGDRPSTLLLALGVVSILLGMLLAVTDRDARRLLGYSAVAQVGFVLLGLGSGTLIGQAGALFHLVNNALYKPALFLTTAAVQRRTGTADLDRLGGVARVMPGNFAAALVCGLALAGLPPFSGFFSKWMLYQGLFEARADGGVGWALGLLAAMVGSALTLAAVAKLIHATYLRKAPPALRPRLVAPEGDTGWRSVAMLLPALLAAAACIGLGVFAERAVLQPLIYPVTGEVAFAGTWWSGTAAVLLVAAVGVGGLLYWGAVGKVRRTPTYVGGEDLSRVHTTGVPRGADRDVEVSGAGFFDTLHELGGLRPLYRLAARGWLDAERVGARMLVGPIELLRAAHTGLLSSYAVWIVLGLCGVWLWLGGAW